MCIILIVHHNFKKKEKQDIMYWWYPRRATVRQLTTAAYFFNSNRCRAVYQYCPCAEFWPFPIIVLLIFPLVYVSVHYKSNPYSIKLRLNHFLFPFYFLADDYRRFFTFITHRLWNKNEQLIINSTINWKYPI